VKLEQIFFLSEKWESSFARPMMLGDVDFPAISQTSLGRSAQKSAVFCALGKPWEGVLAVLRAAR
jgi:hypothetical protein